MTDKIIDFMKRCHCDAEIMSEAERLYNTVPPDEWPNELQWWYRGFSDAMMLLDYHTEIPDGCNYPYEKFDSVRIFVLERGLQLMKARNENV